MTRRKADYLFAPAYLKWIAANNYGSHLLLSECRERRIDQSWIAPRERQSVGVVPGVDQGIVGFLDPIG